ncbi:RNA polymerase sigma factor [Haoranjiania flava]|uniref:Sigma-70 family RNA polymerase sigma factor n=1 Tax=Haoranjiania flava TaxID=1856322 RepID=A0AAE3IK92_9BACT|nr:sigma-70 family RNA polymerase sigma factor [Haoranjiania flava]MCU7693712.1 sigma-70 family RNA polymerase sigma factor [Haoranjiania flava]
MIPELDDKDLLEGLAKNDSAAIKEIYTKNFGIIQSFIINNSGTQDDARDIFQEAMITLYEKANDKDFVLTSQIRTYLYSIARNLWLKKLYKQNRYVSAEVTGLEETIAVEDDLELHEQKNEEYNIMMNALNSLGEPCKTLLEEFYLNNKDMTALTEMFGYTNSDNAKNQKYKCLVRLKKLFFANYHNIKE